MVSTGGDKKVVTFFGVKNWQTHFSGRAHYRATKRISRAEGIWTNPLNALQEAIHYSFKKFCIYCFSVWYEFFVHYTLRVEKIINMVLMRDFRNFSFFGQVDVSPTHSEVCRFESGS